PTKQRGKERKRKMHFRADLPKEPLQTEAPAVNGEAAAAGKNALGCVDWGSATASNEGVVMRSPLGNRDRIIRDQYVRIEDPLGSRTGFLGRIVAGPFFSAVEPANGSQGPPKNGSSANVSILAEIELQGELVEGRPRASKSRPVSQALVQELTGAAVADLL